MWYSYIITYHNSENDNDNSNNNDNHNSNNNKNNCKIYDNEYNNIIW